MLTLWNAFDDRFFDDFLRRGQGVARAALEPPVDVVEHELGYTLRAELPGLKPDEVDISVDGKVLTLKGERHFEGKAEKMPNAQVMMLSTMCGHGMISHSLAKKMIDFVKENRRTPEQCAATLTRFCSCGVFNPSRAKRILEDARTKIS